MRMVSALAAAAVMTAWAGGEAQAARWCSYEGGALLRCGFHSAQQCKRSVGRHGDCRREVAYRRQPKPVAPGMAPGQIYPSRPAWASPYECYLDEGYGRYRPCNGGGDGGGLN
jgi:hypothetical protein